MADLFQQASSWLQTQRHQHLTGLVNYRRGASTVDVAATIDRTLFEGQDEEGVVLQQQVRDYLIRAVDLDFGSGAETPQRGDVIEETQGTKTHRYEVLPAGPDGELWRYSDPYRETLRIHTKYVGSQ